MRNNILREQFLSKINFYLFGKYSLPPKLLKRKIVIFLTSILVILTIFFVTQPGCRDNIVSPQQDAGDTTWVQCQGLPFATGIAANGNTLVAGSYDAYLSKAYIYISIDNGVNWTLNTQFHVHNHSDSPSVPLYLDAPVTFLSYGSRLFAGIGEVDTGDIYVSTDNGISWSDRGISWPSGDTSLGGREDINCFVALGQDIFAGTNHGVFRSTDNGMTWLSINNGLNYDHFDSIYSFSPPVNSMVVEGNNIYAGTGGGVFFSADFGTNWSPINNGLSSLTIMGLTTSQTKIFAGAFPSASDSIGGIFLYQSSNATWKAVNNGLTDHRVNAVASSGTYVFAGTNTGLYISSNEGMSWSYDSIGVPPQTLAVTYLAVLNSHLYVGTLHGVWRYPISKLPKAVESDESYLSQIRKGG